MTKKILNIEKFLAFDAFTKDSLTIISKDLKFDILKNSTSLNLFGDP